MLFDVVYWVKLRYFIYIVLVYLVEIYDGDWLILMFFLGYNDFYLLSIMEIGDKYDLYVFMVERRMNK